MNAHKCRVEFAGHSALAGTDWKLIMPAKTKRGNGHIPNPRLVTPSGAAASEPEASEDLPNQSASPQPAPQPPSGRATSAPKRPKKQYYASVYPGNRMPLQPEFAKGVLALEQLLGGLPIWLVVQPSCPHCGHGQEIESQLFLAFESEFLRMKQGERVGILIESLGGDAHTAYRVGRLLQRRSGNNVTAIIPQRAKSAATLMALGAKDILLGPNAEFGPLDVQMWDAHKEQYSSALNAVQSLECLNKFGMDATEDVLRSLQDTTEKSTEIILPHVMNYVSLFLRPLLEKIDTVDYTLKSRELRVAEEYAVRLLERNYPEASRIAKQLVVNYPAHGFAIDQEEAAASLDNGGLGLNIVSLGAKLGKKFETIIDGLLPYLCYPHYQGMPSFVVGRIICK